MPLREQGGDGKGTEFRPPWGVKFAIAACGSVVTFGWMIRPRTLYVAGTPLYWLIISNLLEFAVCIFFPLWVLKLLWEQARRKPAPLPGAAGATLPREKEKWLTGRRLLILVGLAFALPVFDWFLDHAIKALLPQFSESAFIYSQIVVMIVLTMVIASMFGPRSPDAVPALSSSGAAGTVRPKKNGKGRAFSLALTVIVVLVLMSPIQWQFKVVLFGFAVIYPQFLSQLKRWIFRVGHLGEYDRALRLNKLWSILPFYGESLEGMLLFSAGRYGEAKKLLKPQAFDQMGQPKLTSLAFYAYTLSLVNDGDTEEARNLLEEAVRVPQRTLSFHVALASCLLTRDEQPGRARDLLEQVLHGGEPSLSAYETRARIARYAWALARCGQQEDAQTRISDALSGRSALKDRDLAVVEYFVGEAWLALGQSESARSAFEQVLTLAPDGSIAISAQKGLFRLKDES